MPLASPVTATVVDHAIELDFGANGIGEVSGSNNTTAADGYYELDITLPDGQTAIHHFYRLLGDVNGDGLVDSNDLNEIAAAIGQSSPVGMTPLNADMNGDGTVTSVDTLLASRSKGRASSPASPWANVSSRVLILRAGVCGRAPLQNHSHKAELLIP